MNEQSELIPCIVYCDCNKYTIHNYCNCNHYTILCVIIVCLLCILWLWNVYTLIHRPHIHCGSSLETRLGCTYMEKRWEVKIKIMVNL